MNKVDLWVSSRFSDSSGAPSPRDHTESFLSAGLDIPSAGGVLTEVSSSSVTRNTNEKAHEETESTHHHLL